LHNLNVVFGFDSSPEGGGGTGYQGPVEVVLVEVGKRPKVVALMLRRVMSITITDISALDGVTPLILYKSLARDEAERTKRLFASVGASIEFRVPRKPTSGPIKPFAAAKFAA
jgi:hypothetical protein